jgi:hypothetical protein
MREDLDTIAADTSNETRLPGRRPRRIRAHLRRHRVAALLTAGLAIGVVVFVLVWFEPQKAFLNQTVNEALPVPTATDAAGSAATSPISPGSSGAAAAAAETIAAGEFRGLEHRTTGRAVVLKLADGSLVLRFQDLDTLNGPDLHVYLSPVPAGDDIRAYGEGFVDLGPLKGNKGSQNYRIPRGTDLSRYRSAVIWCRRFSVGFGVAPLEA